MAKGFARVEARLDDTALDQPRAPGKQFSCFCMLCALLALTCTSPARRMCFSDLCFACWVVVVCGMGDQVCGLPASSSCYDCMQDQL